MDRIKEINHSVAPYLDSPDFEADEYFNDVVGVTVGEDQKTQLVHLLIDK